MALPTRVNRGLTLDPYEAVQREFDTVFGRLIVPGQNGDGGQRLAPYPVDVREDADHFYVEAELPGFSKEDINITLENQTLTIAAERKSEKKENGPKGDLLLHERRHNRFLRSFGLAPTVDPQTVNAKLENGVLTVTLNKREDTKPRRIQVS